MITKEKLLQTRTASWHIIVLAVMLVFILAGLAIFFYWYILGGMNKQPIAQQGVSRGVYVYPRYKLENVIKQKIFGTGVDVSR